MTFNSCSLDPTPEALDFQKDIRNYNNSMAMGSMVAKLDTPRGGGPYTFRLHGQVYHVIGSLHPDDGKKHEFAQVFILNTAEAAEKLPNKKLNEACSKEVYKKLIDILHVHNPFVKSFKMMHEKEKEKKILATTENREARNVKMVFRKGKNLKKNRYQLPTAEEVVIVFVEDEIPGKRAITFLSILVILFFGFKCYKHTTKVLPTSSQSSHFKNLQTQLFYALFFQTLIPVILMHTPAFFIFIATFLDCSFELLGQIPSITIVLYPSIDPLPNIFIIKDYRIATLNYLKRILRWFLRGNVVEIGILESNCGVKFDLATTDKSSNIAATQISTK